MTQSEKPKKMKELEIESLDMGERHLVRVHTEWGPFTFNVTTDIDHLKVAEICAWEFIELAKKFNLIEWVR